MVKRKKVALGISAGLLAVGAALAHFKITLGYLMVGLAMVFHVIYAVLLPGTTGESWWKPEFLVSGLAYLTVWYIYALAIGYGLRRFGAFKTPEELEKAAAQERGEVTAAEPPGMFGKLAKYAATAVFVIFIVWLQGKQSDGFMEKSRTAAIGRCQSDSACLQNLDAHFSDCFEANHESHKSGKFNRKHELDEAGFNDCLTSHRTDALQADAEQTAPAQEAATVEPAAADGEAADAQAVSISASVEH